MSPATSLRLKEAFPFDLPDLTASPFESRWPLSFWIGSCMLQAELSSATTEIKASGFNLLEPPRPTSAPHGQDVWGDDVEEEEEGL